MLITKHTGKNLCNGESEKELEEKIHNISKYFHINCFRTIKKQKQNISWSGMINEEVAFRVLFSLTCPSLDLRVCGLERRRYMYITFKILIFVLNNMLFYSKYDVWMLPK